MNEEEEEGSPYPELLRELAYGLGLMLGGGMLGASACYIYFGLQTV